MTRTGHAAALVWLIVGPGALVAQHWQPGTSVELVRRAAAQRVARDADTLLASWSAEAHGMVRFASVLDHEDGPVERVIKADELQVEVYGEAPNRSKQVIVAWRDTTFLPNHIVYHRDHLGIITSDFGGAIRIGDGDEVHDVVHPLSAAGLRRYVFAMSDTVLLNGPAGHVRVVAVRVRPADPDSEGIVGTLYLDLDRAALVRFQFTFTPPSYRDATVEDITVTLENALQENARWLPWRQSIVIRRGLGWLDLPIHTTIREDWTIDNYQLNVRQQAGRFTGPPVGGLRAVQAGGEWPVPIVAALDALPYTEADVTSEQREASAMLAGRVLDGLPRLRILAHGISDILQINRVEGVTPALGSRLEVGPFLLRGRVGYGISDHRVIGGAGVDGPASGSAGWSLDASRTIADLADEPTYSGALNSVTTAISGADRGDYALVERAMVTLRASAGGIRAALSAAAERSTSIRTEFTPISGSASPNPALGAGAAAVVQLDLGRTGVDGDGWSLALEGGRGDSSWVRGAAAVRSRVTLGPGSLRVAAEAGAGTPQLAAYRAFVLGGVGTLPGLPYRALGGREIARIEAVWVLPIRVPTPPFPYSKFVNLPSSVAPLIAVGVAGGDMATMPWRATGQLEPVVGARLDLWGPLFRLESGVRLRTGRVALTFDIHPDWWPLM